MALQHALGLPSAQLAEYTGGLVLSAKVVTVHWLYRLPTWKKSWFISVVLALTMMKPALPAQHAWVFGGTSGGLQGLHGGEKL